jgi:hypothetical protein
MLHLQHGPFLLLQFLSHPAVHTAHGWPIAAEADIFPAVEQK